jgi:hypothetical protein
MRIQLLNKSLSFFPLGDGQDNLGFKKGKAMAEILMFSFLIVLGHIILIVVFVKEKRTGRSNEHRLAMIFSLGLVIIVLISFFVPMLLFSNGYISRPTILVGFISAMIWFVFGYPLARAWMKWKKPD